MTNIGIIMRKIVIPNGVSYEENQNYPLWIVLKEIPSSKESLLSVLFIFAQTHKEAIEQAEKMGQEGEIFYINSMWNMFERLEDMVENETG